MTFERGNFDTATPTLVLPPPPPRSAPAPGLTPSFYTRFGKRIFDILAASSLLVLSAPVVAGLALAIARDGHNPFYGHLRVGKKGRKFRCFKLRSMVPDSAERLRQHLESDPAARLEWQTTFKLMQDPRITRLGHFLRRSSLDELPQLWNVLRGDMSLVGPRPVTDAELAFYGSKLPFYLAVLPGLTGPWQVSGRNDLSYPERVALDVDYVRNFGFLTDLRITLKTALAVLNRTGA